MAVYNYNCPACEKDYDISHAMADDSVRVCPVCGDAALVKRYSAVGISFRGSGFYSTDK